MTALGFDLVPGGHPIIPVMLGDAALATRMADALLAEGIYVIGFSYPVVPKGKARIRTQMSALHTDDEIDAAIAAFAKVGRRWARSDEAAREFLRRVAAHRANGRETPGGEPHDESTGEARARSRASRSPTSRRPRSGTTT